MEFIIKQIQGSNYEKSFQEICLRPPPPNVWRNLTLVQYLRQIKEPAVVPTSQWIEKLAKSILLHHFTLNFSNNCIIKK